MSIQGLGQSAPLYQTMISGGSQSAGASSFEMPNTESVMANDDSNEDGALSIDETPMSEEQFGMADADSDGVLSTEELEEVFSNGPPPMMGGEPPPKMGGMSDTGMSEIESLLAEEDTDEDGSISLEETSLDQEIFSTLDLDQDGLLSQEEIQTGMDEHEARMAGGQGGQATLTQTTATQAYQVAMESLATDSADSYTGSFLSNFVGTLG